jgi:hypothetical protein
MWYPLAMLATMVDADRDGSPQPAMDDKLFTAAHDSLISPSQQLLLFLGFGKNRRCGKEKTGRLRSPRRWSRCLLWSHLLPSAGYLTIGKSLDHPPTMGGLLNPQNIKRSNLPSELFKTVYFTPWDSFKRRFATVTMFLLQ